MVPLDEVRPGHPLTLMSALTDGPVEPGHGEKWAISAADIAILAPMRSRRTMPRDDDRIRLEIA
jgi:hypothetical protein